MLESMKDRFNGATTGFAVAQKLTMGGVFVAVVAAVLMFATLTREVAMAPLYTDLSTAAAADVTEELVSMGVAYELADRGRSVMVPAGDLQQIRLDLNNAGVVAAGSGAGYELLDNLGITSTQFQQQVSFQRALEGELARTITKMSAIDAASVHLVMPEQDLFVNDSIEAAASVLITTSKVVGPEQVAAVVSLIANSVEGLSGERVTVTDQDGRILAGEGSDNFGGARSNSERTREYEQALSSSIAGMLESITGPGNVDVVVAATIDWDEASVVEESVLPVLDSDGNQVKLAESILVESNGPADAAGILGEDGEVLDVTTMEGLTKTDLESSYATSRVVTTRDIAGGSVTDLSVAVLLNDEIELTGDQVSSISSLVTAASGLPVGSPSVEIVAQPFDTSYLETVDTAAQELVDAAAIPVESTAMLVPVVGLPVATVAMLFVALVLAVVALLQMRHSRKPVLGDPRLSNTDLPMLASGLAVNAYIESESNNFQELPVFASAGQLAAGVQSGSDVAAMASHGQGGQLSAIAGQRPEDVAGLLRQWSSNELASR